ncbi:MAG: hypothetical protein R3253_00170 [Longimicrobiales bacterium]|nr:hypothetical protein [Longimicrobiales bacterium]
MALLVLVSVVQACGGNDGILPPDDDLEAIEPFVGSWDAEEFRVTSDADTTIVADLIRDVDGVFQFTVEPSGTYTAQLSFTPTDSLPTQVFVEIGQMSVTDGFITLRPSQPPGPAVSSSYTFLSSDLLRLEGPTDFDFNLDGTLDPAQLYAELRRQ